MIAIKNKTKRKVRSRIIDYCKYHYTKINKNDMELGKGLFNHRCQYNAIQQVEEGNADSVVLVICVSCGMPWVHFINKKGEKYIDNTLGYQYLEDDYYLINQYDGIEDIDNALMDAKNFLVKQNSNWLERKLLRIDKHLI